MELKEIEIKREEWGDNKGKYTGTIKFTGVQGDIKLNISPELSNVLLRFLAPELQKLSDHLLVNLEKVFNESILKSNAPISSKV